MKQKSKKQIFKQTEIITQVDLARLIDVNRSTVSRAAKDMVTTEDKKIVLHEYRTLSKIIELIDHRLETMSWFSPLYKSYIEMYEAIRKETAPLFRKAFGG